MEKVEIKETYGTEGLEKVIDLGFKNVVLGIEIAKDGLNEADLLKAPQVFENIKELVEFISSKPKLKEEIKDLDVMEGLKLVQKSYENYKALKA